MSRLRFFATCPKSIEDLLLGELSAAGAGELKETVAGARFEGSLAAAYRLCLWSRFASRVLLTVAEFPAATAEELLDGVRSIPWDEHFGVEQTFAVGGVSISSTIRHSDYAALVVKDGVADFFRSKFGRRPDVQSQNPDLKISVHLVHDTATLGLDLGGGSLHRRAYRVRGVAAPLKENTASAMLARARWQEIAAAGGAFVDPMCGSGTLPIEAALMAGDAAPGLLRFVREEGGYALDAAARKLLASVSPSGGSHTGPPAKLRLPQGWRGNDASLWWEALREAAERCVAGYPRIPSLFGFDREAAAVAAAKANVASAGLAGKITISRRAVADLVAPSAPPGLVAVNPPYGHRVGEEGRLVDLYQQIGRVLHERFLGWKACVLTADLSLSKSVGLRAARVNTLYNGPIRCVLSHFEVDPENRFVARPPGERGEPPPPVEAPGRRGASAWPDRRPSPDRRAGGPQHAVPHQPEPHRGRARETGSVAHRPVHMPRRGGDTSRGSAAGSATPAGGAGPYRATGGVLAAANRIRRNRKNLEKWRRDEGISCYRLYDADLPDYAVAIDSFEGQWLHVQEYVAPRSIDPEKAADRLDELVAILPETLGVAPENIFVKRRRRRKRTEQYTRLAAGGEFYEVHEGGFSFLVNFTDYLDTGLFLDHRITREMIRAEAGGARFLNLFAYTGTASVYAIGGGAASTVSVDSSNTYLRWARENFSANAIAGQHHQLLRADCWEWLHVDRESYDLIFMDPPTFSNAKGKRATLDIQRDHPKIIRLAIARLAPGGSLLFSTNFRRFVMDRDALEGLTIENITRQTIPRDFTRNSRIHSTFRIRRT